MVEFIPGDILKVKEEWLDVGEDPDTEYFVVDYNPDNSHVKVVCKWNGFTGFLTNEWPADTMYKVGHIDVDEIKKMISMKEEFTDHLIEGYLVETYTSQKAASESERLESEKAFKKELTNGPEKMVTYRDGNSYPKKIGSFDLDNFHKAYDQWFEEQGLLKLFDDEGKLAYRNSYAEIKALDKKIPAVSALLKLWGTQFSYDMMFTKDKLEQEAKEKADKERAEKLTAKFETNKERITKEVYGAVTTSTLWKQLVEVYPESDRNKIKLTIEVYSKDDVILRAPLDVSSIQLIIDGVLLPPNENEHWDYSRCSIQKGLNSAQEVVEESIDDFIKKCTNPIIFNPWLQRIINVSKAAFYLMENYKIYKERLECKVFEEARRQDSDRSPKWIGYFDPATKGYYKAVEKNFGNSNYGLMLINVDDKSDKAHRLTNQCKVVASVIYTSSSEGNCYSRSYKETLFNPSFPESAFNKFGVDVKDWDKSSGMGDNYNKIEDAPKVYQPVFQKIARRESEIDTSG